MEEDWLGIVEMVGDRKFFAVETKDPEKERVYCRKFPCRNIFLRTCHIVCDDEPAHEDDTRSQMQANVFELTNVFVYP